jgi:uncharacterized protein YdhG (YjbR/CyaY superfamily)
MAIIISLVNPLKGPRTTKAKRPRPMGPYVPAKTVAEYLAALPPSQRAALKKIRAQIRAAAPEAQELISYQVPTYRQHGPLVHFMARPAHLSLTVINAKVLQELRSELQDFEVSGRTIHFFPEHPLPARLVRKIVKMRVRQNLAAASG